jgi:hypothetical protein
MMTVLASINWIQIAGFVGTIAPLVTIAIAVYALGSWKRTLHNQRIDECLGAAFDLMDALTDVIEIKRRRDVAATKDAFDQLDRSCRAFDRAYSMVRRYRPNLSPRIPFSVFKMFGGFDADRFTNDEVVEGLERGRGQLSGIIDSLCDRPADLERNRTFRRDIYYALASVFQRFAKFFSQARKL